MSIQSFSSGRRKPGTVTVTFKLKYLWLVVGVVMLLIATSPIVYLYTTNSSATPSAPTTSGGSSSTASVNCSNPCKIIIKNSQFGNGQTYIVAKGTTIFWVNQDDTTHTSTSNTNIWDTGILAPGKTSKPITFSSDGTFPYFCQVHPMQGVIEVVG
ncbi:MAG: cupredoxin domain-containing protein [Nitrososphaerales archaeon]